MSLYNMIFGKNPLSKVLLSIIGKTEEDFPRFRNVYIDKDSILVYTRTGGNNRRCWEDNKSKECKCPGCIMTYDVPLYENYVTDYDDDFDDTYATIKFSIPKEKLTIFKELKELQGGTAKTVSEQFKQFLDGLNKEA